MAQSYEFAMHKCVPKIPSDLLRTSGIGHAEQLEHDEGPAETAAAAPGLIDALIWCGAPGGEAQIRRRRGHPDTEIGE